MCVALTVAAYPLREKWVCDVVARLARDYMAHTAGRNITDPLLTKWVCKKSETPMHI